MHPRKEEEATGGWHNGLSQKVSFFYPPPSIPPLTTPQGKATTPEVKCEALKSRFFPPILPADLSDIPDFQYPAEKFSSPNITQEEIASDLSNAHPHKAPGPDELLMFFPKLLGKPLLQFLQSLFQACLHCSYHPVHFKKSSTDVLRKPGKGDYSVPAAWRPIALLNSLGKVLEAVVAGRSTALTESMTYCQLSRWEPAQGGQLTLRWRCWYSKSMLHGRRTMEWPHYCPLTCLGPMIESCPHGFFITSEKDASPIGFLILFLHASQTAPLLSVFLAFLRLCF